MRHYEIIVIVNVTQEDRLNGLCQKYRKLIDKHKGRVHRFENWGRVPMCYPINKCDSATYLLYNIEAPMKCVNELTNQFRINDSVLRHMCIRREEPIIDKTIMLGELETAAARAASLASERRERGNRPRYQAEKAERKVAEALTAESGAEKPGKPEGASTPAAAAPEAGGAEATGQKNEASPASQ